MCRTCINPPGHCTARTDGKTYAGSIWNVIHQATSNYWCIYRTRTPWQRETKTEPLPEGCLSCNAPSCYAHPQRSTCSHVSLTQLLHVSSQPPSPCICLNHCLLAFQKSNSGHPAISPLVKLHILTTHLQSSHDNNTPTNQTNHACPAPPPHPPPLTYSAASLPRL